MLKSINVKNFSKKKEDKYTLKNLSDIEDIFEYTVNALINEGMLELAEEYAQKFFYYDTNIFHIVYSVDHKRTLSEYYIQAANINAQEESK